MNSLARASTALAWRIVFATAVMPVIILSAIVTYYPIATVGTLALLAGGVVASIAAIVPMVQERRNQRGWLAIAASGIALWAALDVMLFRATWLFVRSSEERLPSSTTLSSAMWILLPMGTIGVLVFARVTAPARRGLSMLLLLLLASWLVLHHWSFFHNEIGLVGIQGYAERGLWVAGLIVLPLALLFVALHVTLSMIAFAFARHARKTTAQPLPAAIVRAH